MTYPEGLMTCEGIPNSCLMRRQEAECYLGDNIDALTLPIRLSRSCAMSRGG